jgi:non-ribosomal peptide synthetase component F
LFDVMLVLHQLGPSSIQLPDIDASAVPVPRQSTKFDATCYVTDGPAGLDVVIEYSTDLFDGETVERWLRHWKRLLDAIAAEPKRRISELAMLTETEQARLLDDSRAARADYPDDRCVHELFEWQVRRSPDATALICEDRAVSYRELNADANRLAHLLRDQGVGPEVLVGLYVSPSLEMVVGLLAILKAGGGYVPLDPNDPPARTALMLSDAGAPLVVTSRRVSARLPEISATVVIIEDGCGTQSPYPVIDPENRNRSDDALYCLYTSGSTGIPRVCWAPIAGR